MLTAKVLRASLRVKKAAGHDTRKRRKQESLDYDGAIPSSRTQIADSILK